MNFTNSTNSTTFPVLQASPDEKANAPTKHNNVTVVAFLIAALALLLLIFLVWVCHRILKARRERSQQQHDIELGVRAQNRQEFLPNHIREIRAWSNDQQQGPRTELPRAPLAEARAQQPNVVIPPIPTLANTRAPTNTVPARKPVPSRKPVPTGNPTPAGNAAPTANLANATVSAPPRAFKPRARGLQ